MTSVVHRVLTVAGCGLWLAGCESLPSLQFPSFRGEPASVALNLESDPPGADAKLSTGASCKTPCALEVPLSADVTVAFSLAGHEPQTVPVRVIRPDPSQQNQEFAGAARLEPNPVYVELQPVPEAAPTRRRPAVHRRTAPSAARSAPAPAPSMPSGTPTIVAPESGSEPAASEEPAAPPPSSVVPATPLAR